MFSDAQLAAASYSFGVVGVALLLLQFLGPSPAPPPLPPPMPANEVTPRAAASTPASSLTPLKRSSPVEVSIPALEVRAPVSAMDRDVLGAVEVPPLTEPHVIGWYSPGPAPGQRGPAVLYGHADSRESGPAVLHRLGELRPGDEVEVTRKDGRAARFTIDIVEVVPKDAFPAGNVYGAADRSLLRLVTCGGRYSEKDGEYLDNIVAYATLQRSMTSARSPRRSAPAG